MWKWLLQPPPRTFRGKAALVIGAVVANVIWSLSMVVVLSRIMGPGYYAVSRAREVTDPLRNLGPWIFLFLVFAVLLEEVIRLAPLAFVAALTKGRKVPVLAAAFLTAIGFGLLHLSNGLPLLSVLLCQAVGGLTFNLLYLKFGGVRRPSLSGFAAAYAGHYLFDATLFALGLLLAGFHP